MEPEILSTNVDRKKQNSLDLSPQENRFSKDPLDSPKTAVRLTYEAQAAVIQKQLGGLAGVQASLGLSGRKICQLLLIDPSAWSRWMKNGQNPPPAVWRALQWYMTVQEKIPGLTASYFLGRDLKTQSTELELRIRALEMRLAREHRRSKRTIFILSIVVCVLLGTLIRFR